MRKDISLEPFAPHVLAAIRTAFEAGWNEISRGVSADATCMRNRFAGTLANLANKGILNPEELKEQALEALGGRSGERRTGDAGAGC
jgi:hypothetical protein